MRMSFSSRMAALTLVLPCASTSWNLPSNCHAQQIEGENATTNNEDLSEAKRLRHEIYMLHKEYRETKRLEKLLEWRKRGFEKAWSAKFDYQNERTEVVLERWTAEDRDIQRWSKEVFGKSKNLNMLSSVLYLEDTPTRSKRLEDWLRKTKPISRTNGLGIATTFNQYLPDRIKEYILKGDRETFNRLCDSASEVEHGIEQLKVDTAGREEFFLAMSNLNTEFLRAGKENAAKELVQTAEKRRGAMDKIGQIKNVLDEDFRGEAGRLEIAEKAYFEDQAIISGKHRFKIRKTRARSDLVQFDFVFDTANEFSVSINISLFWNDAFTNGDRPTSFPKFLIQGWSFAGYQPVKVFDDWTFYRGNIQLQIGDIRDNSGKEIRKDEENITQIIEAVDESLDLSKIEDMLGVQE